MFDGGVKGAPITKVMSGNGTEISGSSQHSDRGQNLLPIDSIFLFDSNHDMFARSREDLTVSGRIVPIVLTASGLTVKPIQSFHRAAKLCH